MAFVLVAVRVNSDEFYLVDEYVNRYMKLSTYDAVALSIAKHREIILMTGDMNLRKAAEREGVAVIGTIGVVDRLLHEELISEATYKEVIKKFYEVNGGNVRLPENELLNRLRSDFSV